jgi:sugar lactone lactonase YvrE
VKAERITGQIAYHGEGPVWDAPRSRLLMVDMLAGDVLELGDPAAAGEPARVTRHNVGSPVAAALRPRSAGGYVVATEHGFALFDDGLERERSLPDVVTDAGIRMNDGGCDPQGRFYCGTMAYDESPGAGTLYRLDPDGSTQVVLKGVGISNGLQWSADGRTAYYVDTLSGRIDAFDFDGADGAFTRRRTFAEVDPSDGFPDGLTVDAEGGVWTALWQGGQVRRYDASGTLTAVIEVPGASRTTAAAFGGEHMDTLYITTSRQGLDDDAEPHAGSLFAVNPGVMGRPLPVFAG